MTIKQFQLTFQGIRMISSLIYWRKFLIGIKILPAVSPGTKSNHFIQFCNIQIPWNPKYSWYSKEAKRITRNFLPFSRIKIKLSITSQFHNIRYLNDSSWFYGILVFMYKACKRKHPEDLLVKSATNIAIFFFGKNIEHCRKH